MFREHQFFQHDAFRVMRWFVIAVEVRLLRSPPHLEIDAIECGLPVHFRPRCHHNRVIRGNQTHQPFAVFFMLYLHGERAFLFRAVGYQRVV